MQPEAGEGGGGAGEGSQVPKGESGRELQSSRTTYSELSPDWVKSQSLIETFPCVSALKR